MVKQWKILVTGPRNVGKTTLLYLLQGRQPWLCKGDLIQPTTEDIFCCCVDADRGSCQISRETVQFIDRPEVNEASCKHWVEACDGVILVYDVTDGVSFKALERLKKDIDKMKDKKELAYLVLGNKCDLVTGANADNSQEADGRPACAAISRAVPYEVTQKWALDNRAGFSEVSRDSRKALVDAVQLLVSRLVQAQKPSRKKP